MSEGHRLIDGVKLAYQLSGEGPPVLQLHGLGSSRRREDAGLSHATAGATGLRVLRVDAPGHGRSGPGVRPEHYTWRGYARLLADLVEEFFGDESVHGVGTSMGAGVLLHAAVDKQWALASLNLVIPPTAWATRVPQRIAYRESAEFIETQGFGAFTSLVTGFPPPPAVDAGQPVLPPDLAPGTAAAVYRGAGESDLPELEALGGIEVPTQVLAWSGDPSHPLSTAEQLQVRMRANTYQVAHAPTEVLAWPERVTGFISSAM